MAEDYKKEQSILNKWFHLRAATQFANSSGIPGRSAACCTASMLTSSPARRSCGVVVILEGIKLAHYSRVPKRPSVAVEQPGRMARAGEPGTAPGGAWDAGGLIPALGGGQRHTVPPISMAGIF